ncbi:hypothetical protein [Roseateles oligotrophus]|uniref:hypothetical protein n=1 Tax=Roseateles oligotrophus TaxID=1769250 RepID=UPI001C886903|nr:hypothetical protein [Roseateles oligotrophus]
MHIDLKAGEANAGPAPLDLGQIQLPEFSAQQPQAQALNLASIHLPQTPQTPALDLGVLGDLSQMLAKVTQSSRQAGPEPEALDLHSVVKAAQGRR